MDEYRDTLVVKSALRLAPMLMLRPGELRQAECDHLELDAAEWRSTVSKTKSEHIVPSDGSGRNTGEVHPSVRVRGSRTHLGCHAGIIKGAWCTNRRHHRPIPHPFRFDAAGASTSRRPTTRSWGTAPKVSQRQLPDSAAKIHVGVIGTCRALRSMSFCWMNGRRDVELPKRSKSLAQNRASGGS